MIKPVIWSDEALADMLQVFEHIAKDNIQNAHLVADRIDNTVDLLSRMQFGRAGRVDGTFEALVPKAPFIIVYQVLDGGDLNITRIIHTARHWPQGEWPND